MHLSGIFIPLITPFTADGAVDHKALYDLATDTTAHGAAGLVVLGTTGEPATLTPAERTAVLETASSTGAPLLVGVGGSATAATVAEVAALPPDVTPMVVVPPYTRPGEAGVLAHFRAVAAAANAPIVIYHVPYRTGQPLPADAILELAAMANVAGLKLSDGPITPATVRLLAAAPPHFAVLGGDDALISPLLALGAHGGILASAHVATAQFVALHDAWRFGDVDTARPLGHRLAALSEALFAEPNPAVVKAVLHAQGRISSPAVRLPLLPATAAARGRALELLARL
ncbi:dihydrodipicolinate synthase family protein [Dactylosporangium vinaceum]|uniref:4-hydroxy-tetrahydrodipicolinate synthase n=1 Tax=Dactylosporangium vinaceum TaxID=53362 RepID=A0ABV5MJI0_9ACTN|nr:dihydrodipicolinate synthase family protein [Dactylosporangium vinaceum]UAB93597.1 dihydrodipicolinate synthase family protein [Dactylosporangium vinaceum]